MGLCSSTASAVKEAPARAPELERAPEQDKTQDKTKVHPAEPLPAPIDDDPDPPIAESIAESIEDSAPAKSAARVRAAGPPVATLESAVARREREEEEAKAMLLGMKEKAAEDRRRALIAEEEAAFVALRERPMRVYSEKKRRRRWRWRWRWWWWWWQRRGDDAEARPVDVRGGRGAAVLPRVCAPVPEDCAAHVDCFRGRRAPARALWRRNLLKRERWTLGGVLILSASTVQLFRFLNTAENLI